MTEAVRPHRAWTIYWSGWQQGYGQTHQIGFWVARCPGVEMLHYVTTGGVVGEMHLGQVVNMCVRDGNPWIEPWTSEARREAVRERAYQRLLEELGDES